MSQESSERVKTFSIGFDEQDFSELHHARRIAEHVGADHHEFIVRPDAVEVLPTLVEHYGEPYADSSAVPTYYVATRNSQARHGCFERRRRRRVVCGLRALHRDGNYGKVSTSAVVPPRVSDQGDRKPAPELGTKAQPGEISKTFARSGFVAARRSLHTLGQRLQRTDKATALFRFLSASKRRSRTRPDLLAEWFKRANGIGILDAMLLTDQMTYLPNDLLVKVDIATMAVSLEARSPFLDHHVIEFAASLPQNLKLRRLTSKYLLKKVLRKLLPTENLNRRKMGFGVPIGHWFRGKMQPFLARGRAFREGIAARLVQARSSQAIDRIAHARRARLFASTMDAVDARVVVPSGLSIKARYKTGG